MLLVLAELSRLVKLEKKLESFGLLGTYGSASSVSSWCVASAACAPFTACPGEPLAVTVCLDGCAGTGAGRSGVPCCDENFELMLLSHELRRPPVLPSSTLFCDPDRLSIVGRFALPPLDAPFPPFVAGGVVGCAAGADADTSLPESAEVDGVSTGGACPAGRCMRSKTFSTGGEGLGRLGGGGDAGVVVEVGTGFRSTCCLEG
jgi:hypothetical protein